MSSEYPEQQAGKKIEILLCEDNIGDQRLTIEAFKDSKVCNRLHIAADGVEALASFAKRGNTPMSQLRI